jgi:hypothetical protein
MTTTQPEYRTLAYRYHDPRPRAGDGIAYVEFCIEQQLSRVFDEHDVATAYRLLADWNPALVAEHVESLLDLADEVRRAEVGGTTVQWHNAVDDYAAGLRRVAIDVRKSHAPVGAR